MRRWRRGGEIRRRRRGGTGLGKGRGLLRKERGGQATDKRAGLVATVSHAAILGLVEPLRGSHLELRRNDARLRKAEGAGRAAQPMGVTSQCFECGRVVTRGDEPFG